MKEKNNSLCFIKNTVNVVLYFIFILSMGLVFPCCTNKPSSPTPTKKPVENYIERFKSGTTVEGIDISSFSYSEAYEVLSSTAEKICTNYECKLHHDEKTYFLTSAELDIHINVADTLNQAMTAGSGEYKFKYEIKAGSDLENRLNDFAEAIFEEPTLSRPVWKDGAGIGFEEASPGAELDIEKTLELIVSGEREIEMPLKKVGEDGLAEECVLRGKFSTSFYAWNDGQRNRAFNIRLAAEKLNETVLRPGEELSCNRCFGERNRENGWRKASAFTNGGRDSEQQYGGGICQVSTTLYNAALLADLTVTCRCGHSKPVYYAEPGTDAAISGDVTDLRIRNDTDGDIYIFVWVDEQTLFCEIYGKKFDDTFDEIRLISQYAETIQPGEPVFESSRELARGECQLKSEPVCGSVYFTYRLYYKKGRLIKKVNVSKTEYLAHPAVYLIGE